MIGPGYWMDETSGVLRPAVVIYLRGEWLAPPHIAAIRAYLRQWIEPDVWGDQPEIEALRQSIDGLTTQAAIDAWLAAALEINIDPF
jgi:hypothetical protein